MAEIFGLVAGGVGAVSLVIQLSERIIPLRTHLKSIRDAPKDVHEMLLEIEHLADLMRETEAAYIRESHTTALVLAQRTLNFCQDAANEMKPLLKDLDGFCAIVTKKYSWRSFKVHTRKERIQEIRSKSQKTFRMLVMVNQVLFQ